MLDIGDKEREYQFYSEILVIFSHNSSPPNLIKENKIDIDDGLRTFFQKTSFNYQNIEIRIKKLRRRQKDELVKIYERESKD